ncbi:MAG: CRTAC1 family protein [Planctomycetes bacterium]|nr:CRTAC1 family protein [Planctomycetota bacterium]
MPHSHLCPLLAAFLVQTPATPVPLADGNARKEALLRKVADDLDASTAPFLGRGGIAAAQARLAEAQQRQSISTLFAATLALADARLAVGEIEPAIAEYDKALKFAQQANDSKAWVAAAKKGAIAWLRLAERQNCVARHNQDSCLFPLKGGAIHVDPKGSKQAILFLEAILKIDPGDMGAAWLLNVAHMTLGTWPAGVPPTWRIPESAIESEHELPRMLNIASALGVKSLDLSGGAIMDDFDGDGALEIVTSTIEPRQPLRFFRRQTDGTWLDESAQRGLSGQLGGLQIHAFDANNDGRLDLAVQRGAWLSEFGRIPNSLLIQQQDGSFVDRTLEAGVEVAMPSQVVCTADIDLDGDLDLFLGHENNGTPGASEHPCHLFRNRGDGTFDDVTKAAGVANLRFCKGAAFGDYDGDGYADLYVSNLHDLNRLYRNLGDGTFRDVALELGVADPLDSFPCWFFDADNDGWLDLFVGSYEQHDRTAQVYAWYRNGTTGLDSGRFYRNDGKGGFIDATRAAGLARPIFPMGASYGDVDEDGFQDLYLATGDPEFGSLWPNVLLRNDGGKRFEDVTAATGTGHLQKGHGVAFGDLDGDGDQDLFVQLGGAWIDDQFDDALFENPGHGRHWLTVRPRGKDSNRFGVGTRIKVTIEEGGATRDVVQFIGAQSSFGGNSLQAEMGLGAATRIIALELFWPKGRKTQRFEQVPLDRVVVVEEGSDRLQIVEALQTDR